MSNNQKLYENIKIVKTFIDECREKLKKAPDDFAIQLTLLSFERHEEELLSQAKEKDDSTIIKIEYANNDVVNKDANLSSVFKFN